MAAPFQKQLGLTLIELLITVSIVGIMLTIAVPSFQTVVQDRKQNAKLSNFQSTLLISRSEAIKRGLRTVVCASSDGVICSPVDWDEGWFSFVDENNDGVPNPTEQIIHIGEGLEDGFSLIGSVNVASTITYEPDGDTLETGAITLCDPRGVDKAEAIIITASGRPKISSTGSGGVALACP